MNGQERPKWQKQQATKHRRLEQLKEVKNCATLCKLALTCFSCKGDERQRAKTGFSSYFFMSNKSDLTDLVALGVNTVTPGAEQK